MNTSYIAKFIDYTLLSPSATTLEIETLCSEAVKYGCASVCVNSVNVPKCKEFLKESDVKVCSVIGFPLGAQNSVIKVAEAKWAVKNGANEIDMVINIGALKDKKNTIVRKEIKSVKKAIGENVILKVIIETCLLTADEKTRATQIAQESGADFVKTSTGFSTGGATVEDVALMRNIVQKNCGVKASGGIKTLEMAQAMIDAGANRLGCSREGAKTIIEASLSNV